ncbi:MAG TPA: alpha/beta hydrolase [Solirubrobacter sp.]|nr:alpha/beta hydrolase [Solirubrobacter sp.]
METVTYALIHGAGSDGWYWHRVAPLLSARGHDVVTMDLPVTEERAGLREYTDVVVDAIGEREHVVVVAQSLGGFVAPLVAARRPVERIVFVNAMIPRPGESDWWTATQHPVPIGPDFDPVEVFLHDVPAEVVAESAAHAGEQADAPMTEPWPLDRWPDVPVRAIIGRDDRFFPADWQARIVRERLGIEPEQMPGGHCLALSRPRELADLLASREHGADRTEHGA